MVRSPIEYDQMALRISGGRDRSLQVVRFAWELVATSMKLVVRPESGYSHRGIFTRASRAV